MSLALVDQIARELPPRLADDLIGYARSVSGALPEIFRDARVAQSDDLASQLVLIAAVKKLYSICSSNYWILDNSLHALQRDAGEVRLGSTVVSRRSPYFLRLQKLQTDLLQILGDQGLFEFMEVSSYAEIARRLSRER